ncbi:hypothetical protein [Anaerorhabdus sp.]|uniref:hypothetical protein n=1 Tax=Anaerorhabdus sp. TaxID=1872524 RepID=UPI002B1F5F73|nr:hypothetical protein [Anaerorhabdus sp.]MEA4874681.1 hypothetical protein [Anaerorhabdus sp.]
MNKLGYTVNYQENYKHITYICPNGMKCRDNKLHHKKYLKEALDYEFEFGRCDEQDEESNVGFIQSNRVSDRRKNQENQMVGMVLGIGAIAFLNAGIQLDESIDDKKYKRYTRHEKKHKRIQKKQEQEM